MIEMIPEWVRIAIVSVAGLIFSGVVILLGRAMLKSIEEILDPDDKEKTD